MIIKILNLQFAKIPLELGGLHIQANSFNSGNENKMIFTFITSLSIITSISEQWHLGLEEPTTESFVVDLTTQIICPGVVLSAQLIHQKIGIYFQNGPKGVAFKELPILVQAWKEIRM